MTYEEYQAHEATLKAALVRLHQKYIAEHGLPVGTRVWCKGKLGYVESVTMTAGGTVWHKVRAAKKDGTMAQGGKPLAYLAERSDLEVAP